MSIPPGEIWVEYPDGRRLKPDEIWAEYPDGRRVLLMYNVAVPPAPGYWMDETGPILRPAITAYLHRRPLTSEQVEYIRAYLKQWIEFGAWAGAGVDELRRSVNAISDEAGITNWLRAAEKLGIDPL